MKCGFPPYGVLEAPAGTGQRVGGEGLSRRAPPRQSSSFRRSCLGFSYQPGSRDPEALNVRFPRPEAATGLTGGRGGLGSGDFPPSQSLSPLHPRQT